MAEQENVSLIAKFSGDWLTGDMLEQRQKSIMDKALNLGAKDFLIKPFFNAKEIDQKIQKAFA